MLPVHRSHADARRTYDRLAPWYEWLAGPSEAPLRRAALALLDPRPGERVLEVGYGTGTLLVPLAEAVGEDGAVIGVDLSPGMRARAEARLRGRPLAGRVRLHVGDALALPLGDADADAALICFTLELLDTPEIPRALAEVRRVLVPGGRLAVAALSDEGGVAWMRRGYAWAHVHFERWADCRPIPAARLLAGAGFALERVEKRSTWGLPVDLALGRAR